MISCAECTGQIFFAVVDDLLSVIKKVPSLNFLNSTLYDLSECSSTLLSIILL
jgi:hypothetical protein